MTSRKRHNHRIERHNSPSGGTQVADPLRHRGEKLHENAVVDCGWGRLIFAHTFAQVEDLVETLRGEEPGHRDLALYLRDPHVALAKAPQELFLDPSHTYRLWLSNYLPGRILPQGFDIRRLQTRSDAEDIHRLLRSRNMVAPSVDFIWSNRRSKELTWFIAVDVETDRAIGTVQGVDHKRAFGDPENGSSMWCLAVDPQARQPGIGRCLTARIADHYAARGRAFMDLSVMHDNEAVIRLYENMGFVRITAFSLKTKNAINEPLFTGPQPDAGLNPYARIIVDEARRRGIGVDILDAGHGYFQLSLGGRSIICRESLTELTTAIAMSRCDNKSVTHRIVSQVGIRVPRQQPAGEPEDNQEFLRDCGAVVVKPASGEQGRGVSVNITQAEDLDDAIDEAHQVHPEVLLEEFGEGQDLRVIVIDFQVVAAAIRRPPTVTGNGQHTVRDLIQKQNRRRGEATGGESRIPIDAETRRCLGKSGYDYDDVLPDGETIQVREAANLHTGGTLHDVTDELCETLRDVSVRCAQALDIPVAGLDFIVPDPSSDEYLFIEANERPGLANHEPQPTAERFMDFLFPATAVRHSRSES